ncbi:MAG: phosphatidylserine/phosphatidylglycerophosphate/cardiolipin synthase family protein [Clostridia bacterium]|nr:phosphatidylserine/phosphatidylglycerophosphate/cardiolipin synthase family protein [Clostridia bacterium]
MTARILLLALAALILFQLFGNLLPTLIRKDLTADEQQEIRHLRVTSDTPGPERVRLITDNTEALEYRIRAIESAQHDIILSTFCFMEHASGKDLSAALLHAADRGVQVRILVDGYHGTHYFFRNHYADALASHPNVTIRLYNRPSPGKPWRWNYRMHDKYLIIDDQIFLLGGRNTEDRFLGKDCSWDQPVYDLDFLVYNSTARRDGSLADLQEYFASVWDLSTNRSHPVGSDDADIRAAREELTVRYRNLSTKFPGAFSETDWEEATVPSGKVTLLHGDPRPRNKTPFVESAVLSLMSRGTQATRTSPYVILDRRMREQLTEACKDTQICLILNSPQTGNNPLGSADFLKNRPKVLQTGVTTYELHTRPIHAKSVVIDDRISIVGSLNYDIRSTYQDTELMLVVDSEPVNRQLRAQIGALEDRSVRTDPDGTETEGSRLVRGELDRIHRFGYRVLGLFDGLLRNLY